MEKSRKTERSRAILGATVIYNNKNSTVECQIRNISKTGARLSISDTVSLPEEFDIEVPQKGKTYRARLCWRDESSAGIEFVLEAAASPAPGLQGRVAELEAENAALRLRIFDLRERLETALAAVDKPSAQRVA